MPHGIDRYSKVLSFLVPNMESTGERGGGGGGGGGDGSSGLGFTEIETSAERLGSSEIFHVVKELIGFVLYMHHQIPSILQNLEDEFSTLKEEYKTLESVSIPAESKASFQRLHNTRKREVRMGIKRLEKLMNAVSSLLSALHQALDASPHIQGITLVLGGNPARPQHVYEIVFPCGRVDSEAGKDCTRSKAAEVLSRKAIRALISSGAGSCSYTGPTKLFLLVKSPTLNLPLHFLPKRDFRYHKKVVPFRLRIKCKTPKTVQRDSSHSSEVSQSTCLSDSLNDVIWFQCRHTIKGLASKTPVTEC